MPIPRENLHDEGQLREALQTRFGGRARLVDDLAALSAIGAGINATYDNVLAGSATLAAIGIAPAGIATSSFRITWLVPDERVKEACAPCTSAILNGNGRSCRETVVNRRGLDQLTDLRGILQDIPQFREKIFILAIDAGIVVDDSLATLLLDVALLRSLNIRVVLVHGAAERIRALADERQVLASDLEGAGVTDAATLDLALTAANRLTHEILEGLSANDLRAACTNVIVAHPLGVIQGVDHLYTGRVERVDADFLQSLLAQGVIPIIPPLGFDGDGKTYRVNSDAMAVAVAAQLKAVKLIFVTTQRGLLYNGAPIRQMLVDDLRQLLERDRAGFTQDMLSKARHAVLACNGGVPRVHVIDGTLDEGLLGEVFDNHGYGTLIHANDTTTSARRRGRTCTRYRC